MTKSKKSQAPASGAAKKQNGKRGAKTAAAAAPASAAISATPAKKAPAAKPTPEQISARAHQIWIDAGKPVGQSLEHWLRAERELS